MVYVNNYVILKYLKQKEKSIVNYTFKKKFKKIYVNIWLYFFIVLMYWGYSARAKNMNFHYIYLIYD
jgi:hypothetical protein